MVRFVSLFLILALSLISCSAMTPETDLHDVILMLDWVPNANHSGIFIAQSQGYFEDAGLRVRIIEPGEVYPEQAVAGGAADFGVSFQEQLTLVRADGVPLVSIAAIIQHNSSGFASRGSLGAESPADWEGLRYGSFGSPFEAPTLESLMRCAQADPSRLEIVETGFADPLALLDEEQIDLAWIFYGWQGIQAEELGIDLNLVMLDEWQQCIPDYYTPIIITSESTLQQRPEIVRAFLEALSRGYGLAIDDPSQAASLLLQAVPELEPTIVQRSQDWLADRYQATAPRWGEQRLEVWDAYSRWMASLGILDQPIDASAAFTNDFLP